MREERKRRRDRQERGRGEAGDRPGDRPAQEIRGEAGRDRDDDHADVEAAHRVGACQRDQPQEEVPARRLGREDVLAEPLPVLQRVDARQVHALVVVGPVADEPPEERGLSRDENREREALPYDGSPVQGHRRDND